MDGFILAQILVINLERRKRYYRPLRSIKTYVIIGLIFNILGIATVAFFGELSYFLKILFGEIIIAGVGFGIGFGVIYSIETWFEFIA